MRVTLSITNPEQGGEDQDLVSLEIYSDMTIETLRSSIQAETRIEPASQHLYLNGRLITDNSKTMAELEIGDGELLALHVRDMRGSTGVPAPTVPNRQAQQQRAEGPRAAEQDAEVIRLQLLGDPRLRAEVSRQQPELASALEDPQRFAQVYAQSLENDRRARAERQRQIQLLNADPFDPEAQAKIAEIIRQERVMENLQNAMEHNPEVFGRVHLLYVDVEVNGHKVKALVDTGAQATIMSPACANACGIMRLIDTRFAGVARGVGTATIIGRVHTAQIKIGTLFLPCSFTVMEGKSVELLLGLDMLKRHQACVDLTKDKLIIQGVEVAFLGEADIPKETEEALEEEPKVPGPAGTTIGQRSGAVSAPGTAEASGSRPAASNPAPAPARPTFPREHIDQLKALGASEQKAIQALEATGGNVEWAAGLIFED